MDNTKTTLVGYSKWTTTPLKNKTKNMGKKHTYKKYSHNSKGG